MQIDLVSKAPATSRGRSYQELCIAAKNEERQHRDQSITHILVNMRTCLSLLFLVLCYCACRDMYSDRHFLTHVEGSKHV